jgi:hypothetical protein
LREAEQVSEFIDRLAHAIWDVRRAKAAEQSIELEEWGDGSIPRANHVFDEVRAVLAAMEQPSQKMIDAGEAVRAYDGLEELDSYGPPNEVWRAMITAELKSD